MNYLIKVAAGAIVSWYVQQKLIPFIQAKLEAAGLDEAWDVFDDR